MFNKQINLSK